MGTDDNIRLILDQVAIPISSYLGLDEENEPKVEEGELKNENHQVEYLNFFLVVLFTFFVPVCFMKNLQLVVSWKILLTLSGWMRDCY